MTDRLSAFLQNPYFWAAGLATAAALALSWALRGAPIGQAPEAEADEDAPDARYRDRVVAMAVAGLLLIAAGAFLAVEKGVAWSLPPFAIGYGTTLALIRANRRYRHASPSLRRVVDTSNAALTASLLGGVLIVGNVLAFKYGGRAIDLTHDRAFTLAPMTANLLQALDRPATFTLVFGQSRTALEQADRVRQLLGLFRARNPGRVKVAFLNPFAEPERFEEFIKRAPDLMIAATQGGAVLIEYGEGKDAERAVVRNNDLFEIASAETMGGESGRLVSDFRGEDALTSALARLREGKRSRIGFVTGHGEPSIHDADPARPGLGLLRARLEGLGSRALVVGLVEDVDPGIELLVIAGPRTPIRPEELERLRTYLARGGRLLVLVGPPGEDGEPSGLEGWLKSFDVEVGPGTVFDRLYRLRKGPEYIWAPIAGDAPHPIVEALLNRRVVLPYTTPVQPAAKPTNAKITVAPILKSSPESWVRTDTADRRPIRGEREPAGPVPLAVAVAERDGDPRRPDVPRMVVIGSRQVADNPFSPHNFDLIVNAANWLRGRSDLRGAIPAKQHTALILSASPEMRTKIVLVPTLMAFSVILGFGIATYLARRD